MKLTKKIKRFLDKPRESRILSSAESILYEKGFLWRYYNLVFKIAILLFLLLMIFFIWNGNLLGFILNGVFLACVVLAYRKFKSMDLVWKTGTPMEIIYKRKGVKK